MALAVLGRSQRALEPRSPSLAAALTIFLAVTAIYALTLPTEPAAPTEATGSAVFALEVGALVVSSALLIAHERRGSGTS